MQETCSKAISMLEAQQKAQVIHWYLCEKLGYDRDEKYYNHEPQPAYEPSTEQDAVGLPQNTD